MKFEIPLKSEDPARPNDHLLRQILAQQNDLVDFLREEDSDVEGITVEPLAGFPTGLEVFVITVVVSFGTGVAAGIAKGVGNEIGKTIGSEVGRRIGARIRLWLERRFPDLDVR
jgi:hypothetical protein